MEHESIEKILFVNHAPNESHMLDMQGLFQMSFMGPLAELKYVKIESFWFGPWLVKPNEPVDRILWEKCVQFKPNVVFVYGWYQYPIETCKPGYVALTTIYLLRELLNIRVVPLLFDQAFHNFKITDNLVQLSDHAFTHEHDDVLSHYTKYSYKHFHTNATFSPKLFHLSSETNRDINVSFVGGIDGLYPIERKQGILALEGAGVPVYVPGGRGASQIRLSNEEYASTMRRSKIILNWSKHISGNWYQAKGRIFEASLAGSLLISEECDAVNRYFTPNVEYIPFTGTRELINKVKYYLSHEEERLKIASKGHSRAMREYSAGVMWDRMLKIMGGVSLYEETEGRDSLKRNASKNELYVAHFFYEMLKNCRSIDQKKLKATIELVELGNRSLIRRAKSLVEQVQWNLRKLRGIHWRLLRLILPRYITRNMIKKIYAKLRVRR